jgi:hypothetical protein
LLVITRIAIRLLTEFLTRIDKLGVKVAMLISLLLMVKEFVAFKRKHRFLIFL